jgi:hypothetical protein
VIRNYQYGTNCVLGFLNVTVDNNCISVGREHKDTNVALDNDCGQKKRKQTMIWKSLHRKL